ncbi:MAG: hypothetical protein ACOWWM_04970 [Desulfobacterales bacterium]
MDFKKRIEAIEKKVGIADKCSPAMVVATEKDYREYLRFAEVVEKGEIKEGPKVVYFKKAFERREAQ